MRTFADNLLVIICLHAHTHPWKSTCGGQKIAAQSQFSPPTLWDPLLGPDRAALTQNAEQAPGRAFHLPYCWEPDMERRHLRGGRLCFGSQRCGGQKPEAAAHTASAGGKQRADRRWEVDRRP